MNEFKITFKRIEAFYHTIIVQASSATEAWKKANAIARKSEIIYDYHNESDFIDEYICGIEEI